MPRKVIKVISFLLCFCLLFQQTGFAQVAGQLDISGHILSLRNSFIQDKFRPLHLRYLSYDNQANNFRLLLDKGDFEKGLSPKGTVPEEKLKEETKTLLNYFFIGISLPNDSFWVNLRPDSENEVIDPELGKTDVGKILLEADLQLKKDTAKFTSPETLEGKKYWAQLYKKAEELFGYENITIPTLTRPWIVPDEIIIRETQDNAYIYKATLKVMLEQDYLKDSATYSFKDPRLKALNEYSSQLLRELIIPKLTKEINTSKRYAPLRQVYYSLILAQWFKQRFYGKGGLYSWLIDKKNLNGLTSKTPWSKTTYFQSYQKSFKEGEYNLKEPTYTPYGQTIRSYMSGGIGLQDMQSAIGSHGAISGKRPFNFFKGFLASILVLGATNIAEPAEVKVALQEKPPIEIALQSVTGLAQDNASKATVQQEEQVEIYKKVEEKVASKKRSEISLISTQLETPEEIELSEIAHIKLEPYMDYKLYKLKNKPIYYVEFASRAVQNSTFDRLSAFVESETYSGRILEDEELKNAIETIETGRLTQGIGHDYKIEDICRFYTQAKNRNVVLNAWEENLKKDLIRLGIIEYRDAIYKPTKKIAVISAAQDIGGLRIDTILHEFRHAIYLTEPFVRESIKKVWDSVDPNQRSKIITAVHVLADYDRKNLDLILNELYASLLDYSSPLSRIVSNNPKGWAPSPEAMSYLFAEFKRIEENRLINGVMGSTFFKNFLEDVNKRLYISKPAATESEPSSSRSTRDSAEPAEVKVALQERPPIEIIAGLAQDNASKAPVQQEERVEQERNLQSAGDKNRYPYKRDPLDMFIGADSAVLALKEKLNLNKNTTIDFYNQLSQKLIQELKNNGIDHTKELSRADKYLITVLMFKVIEEANFEIKDSSFSITLTPQFKTPVDCDLLSFIFLKMAYDLDLPLHFILMPGHAALVWSDKDITFDIDPRWELQDKVYETFFKPLLERLEEFKKRISQNRPDLFPEKRRELIEEALEKALADPVKKYLSIDEEEHNKDRYRIELNQHELEGIILFTEVQNLTAIAEDPQRFGITDFKTPYQFRVLAKGMYKRLIERSKQPECQALYAGFYINSLQELYWIDKDAGFFKNQEEEVKAWKETEEERAKYMKFLSIGLHAGLHGDSPDQLLETQITQLVNRLGLATLKRELIQARQHHEAGKISGEEFVREELRTIRQLVRGVLIQFRYEDGFFDLPTVLKERKADCGGFTRLIYLLGKQIGLSVTPIEVTDISGKNRPLGQGHMASFFDLSNGMKVMVELTAGPNFAVGDRFILEKEFEKIGNWYEQKPDGDFLPHKRFRILGEAGLVAYEYNSKGFTFYRAGQYQKAKTYFEKAVGLDGELAIAYLNLGSTYTKLYPKLDKSTFYSKIALELDPKLVEGHYNLGIAYLNQGRYTEALQPFEKFLKDAPDYGEYAKYKKEAKDIITKLKKGANVSQTLPKSEIPLDHKESLKSNMNVDGSEKINPSRTSKEVRGFNERLYELKLIALFGNNIKGASQALSDLQNMLRTEWDYRHRAKISEAIKIIAEGRPELITLFTVSALHVALINEELGNKTLEDYRPIVDALMAILIAREDLDIYCLSGLEEILGRSGLDPLVYAVAHMGINEIAIKRPHLIEKKSLAAIALTLPLKLIQKGLPPYQIYFNEYFKTLTKRMSHETRYEIALSTFRLLVRLEIGPNDKDIEKAVDFIIKKRAETSRIEVFAPGIKVINFIYSEEKRSIDDMVSLEQQAGVDKGSITFYQGKDKKQDGLQDIATSRGRLSIHFNWHGDPKYGWLESGESGSEEQDSVKDVAISYQELGDALLARGGLEEVIILNEGCKSYNFSVNLLRYLEEKGTKVFPVIVSASNFNRVSYNTVFLNNLKHVHKAGRKLTMEDVIKAQQNALEYQDATIFVPIDPKVIMDLFGLETITPIYDEQTIEREVPFSLPQGVIEIGFFGRGGQVRTGDLDILGEPADLVIQNVKATDLAISESGINPKTYNIGNYTVEVQIDNTITDIVAFSEDGKVVSINLAKLNAILEKLGVKGNQDALKGFLIHELAEAVALQMGRNQAEAHTAGLMAEAYFVQGNPIARDALAKLWKEREEKYGAWGEKVRPADETPPPADEQRANRILKEKLNTDLKVDGPTTPYSVYRQIYNTKEDPLGGIEHSILFDTFLEIYRKREGLDIKLSDGLKEKLIDNIKRIHRFDRIVTLAISGDLIRELREIIQLASSEEAELWRIYHLRAPSNEIKRTSDDVNVHLGIYSHIDEAISSRAGSIPIKVLDLGCGPVGEAIVGLKKKYGEKIDAYGIDINIEIEKEGVFLRQGDIKEQLSFSDNFFDIIYARVVMDYFTDRELRDGIKKIVRTLKPGGKFVFDTWIRSGGSVYEIILQELAGLADVKLEDGILIIVTKKGSEDEELGKAVKLHSSDPSRPGGIVGSTKDSSLRSESIPPEEKKTGGIDFRGLPIVTQPMQTPLGTVPKNILGSVPFGDRPYKTGTVSNLDEEWSQIERMLNSGIIPSSQRIKEYLERSCSSQDCSERIDRVLSSIADILRLEEERVSATEPALREILVLLESDKPASAIQAALSKITVASKEPVLIK